MPARDRYHNEVRSALIKDGWTITDDPLHLKWGAKDLYVDLGAEQLLAAEKGARKIAVEIKSFGGASDMEELERATGQYVIYLGVLGKTQPDRELFLAIPEAAYLDLFDEPIGKMLMENLHLRLLIFDPDGEVIQRWIP